MDSCKRSWKSKLSIIIGSFANNRKSIDQGNLYKPSSTDNYPYYDDGPVRKDEEISKLCHGPCLFIDYIRKLKISSFLS